MSAVIGPAKPAALEGFFYYLVVCVCLCRYSPLQIITRIVSLRSQFPPLQIFLSEVPNQEKAGDLETLKGGWQ